MYSYIYIERERERAVPYVCTALTYSEELSSWAWTFTPIADSAIQEAKQHHTWCPFIYL
jgi:hypothetical protein